MVNRYSPDLSVVLSLAWMADYRECTARTSTRYKECGPRRSATYHLEVQFGHRACVHLYPCHARGQMNILPPTAHPGRTDTILQGSSAPPDAPAWPECVCGTLPYRRAVRSKSRGHRASRGRAAGRFGGGPSAAWEMGDHCCQSQVTFGEYHEHGRERSRVNRVAKL